MIVTERKDTSVSRLVGTYGDKRGKIFMWWLPKGVVSDNVCDYTWRAKR